MGEEFKTIVVVHVCVACGAEIAATGECSFDCERDWDSLAERSGIPGSYVTRTYRRVDTLMSQESN